jgi:hypothetical protein
MSSHDLSEYNSLTTLIPLLLLLPFRLEIPILLNLIRSTVSYRISSADAAILPVDVSSLVTSSKVQLYEDASDVRGAANSRLRVGGLGLAGFGG